MAPALIAQLILQFGIPATREILELIRSSHEPTVEEWLSMLARIETKAKAFMAQTAYLDHPATPKPAKPGT